MISGDRIDEVIESPCLDSHDDERRSLEYRPHPAHTHAYELMMEKIAMPIIQRQLGHLSLATTDRYLNHIAPIQVIEEIRAREW